MKSTGYMLKERAYVGGVAPPDTFEDESRFGNDGTHTNITWVKNPAGLWERSFNGSSSLITLGSGKELDFTSEDFSVSFWIQQELSPDDDAYIFARGTYNTNGWYLWWYRVAEELQFYTNQGGGVQVSTMDMPSDGLWRHITLTRAGASAIFYENAVDVTKLSGSHTDPLSVSIAPEIGVRNVADYFGGQINLLKILKYALSVEQIAAIFQNERHFFGV